MRCPRPPEDEVLDQAPDLVVGERGDHGGPQPERPAQAARDVVLSAALPGPERAGGADPALPRVEAEHHLTQRDGVVPARPGRADPEDLRGDAEVLAEVVRPDAAGRYEGHAAEGRGERRDGPGATGGAGREELHGGQAQLHRGLDLGRGDRTGQREHGVLPAALHDRPAQARRDHERRSRGTVLTPDQVDQAVAAGATFVVSPGLSRAVVERCREHGVLPLPGAVTATEIQAAMELGLTTVKFFPAGVSGGARAIAALAATFGGVTFVPTGGVGPDDLGEYLSIPAAVSYTHLRAHETDSYLVC